MTRGRPSGPKVRCGGAWTEAKYKSFIKQLLRRGTIRWGPIQKCAKDASTRRGFFKCASCGEEHPVTILLNGKRVKNKFVDHIDPVVDPALGFTTWDSVINRMFCEIDNLQVLCKGCHDIKSAEEREIAKNRGNEDDE